MEKITYPHRVRLYGGRNTHAARDHVPSGHMTGCGTYLARGRAKNWLPPAEAVTCPRCQRAIAKAGSR